MEYRPVRVRGHFKYDNEIFIGPRSHVEDNAPKDRFRGEAISGLYVITPFKLEDRE